jgi:hypothetical protein
MSRLDDLRMYDLPAVGSLYWRGRDPFVRAVDLSTEPPTVHFEHNPARAVDAQAVLPDAYWPEGGRSASDGRWTFHLERAGLDRPIGLFLGETLDEALGQVVSAASEHAQTA